MPELTPSQQWVLGKLRDGWLLTTTEGLGIDHWHVARLERSGEWSKSVHWSTSQALIRRGEVELRDVQERDAARKSRWRPVSPPGARWADQP